MLKKEVIKINISELPCFFETYHFSADSVVPVTPQRVASYCKNPRAKGEDYSLYFILDQNKIIAFRTIWADVLTVNGVPVHFGWCSGNWVDPEWRRKGLSLYLLKEVYHDWNGKLMFTNYAPASLKGYRKSNFFNYEISRNGRRFYLKTNFYRLLKTHTGSKFFDPFFRVLNWGMKLLVCLRMALFKPYRLNNIQVEETEKYNDAFFDGVESGTSLFGRTTALYKWIFGFPWITTKKNEALNYPFTQFVSNFKYRFVKFRCKQNIVGALILSNRNGKVKLLFAWSANGYQKLLVKYLVNYCYKNKIDTLTIVDNYWADLLSKLKTPFAGSRPFSMNIYSTFDLKQDGRLTFDGDGDYIFT